MLDPVTLDQLRIFIAVAETGSFSAAARRLARVQSAISQSVQTLEAALGVALFDRSGKTPVLTDSGRVLLEDARHLVHGAETLRARAESIASDVEAELTLAVESLFPDKVLMASLKALSGTFPHLPVTLFTEGLGGPEQRLRDGTARLAIYSPLTTGAKGLETEFLVAIRLVPVVAATHPLAKERGPITREIAERHVQLVLTDRTPLSTGLSGNILSTRIWRFADLSSRLDYLLAGFGWCYMPLHQVEGHTAAGRLKRLDLKNRYTDIALHIIHEPGRSPGRAGSWLIDDLRRRLAGFPAVRPVKRHRRRRKP